MLSIVELILNVFVPVIVHNNLKELLTEYKFKCNKYILHDFFINAGKEFSQNEENKFF